MRNMIANPLLIAAAVALGLFAGLWAVRTAGADSIPIDTPCGKTTPAANGDGDGDEQGVDKKDDYQLDIDPGPGLSIVRFNGTLELWCINKKYYALEFKPSGAAKFQFIGKCPWVGGKNTGDVFFDFLDVPGQGTFQIISRTVWESTDDNPHPRDFTEADDDAVGGNDDGIRFGIPAGQPVDDAAKRATREEQIKGGRRIDRWVYAYDAVTGQLTQEHLEAPEVAAPLAPLFAALGDGVAAAAPPERKFTFGDLRPLNPFIDNPAQPPAIDPCEKDAGVGGEAGLLDDAAPRTEAAGGSGSAPLAPIAAAVAAGVAALAVGGWYARRRWIR